MPHTIPLRRLRTPSEVGGGLGVSKERVKQIQNVALLVIRQVREAQRYMEDETKIRRRQYRFGRWW